VARARIVIIESDEWTATLLAKFLRDAGFEVDSSGEARAGFDRIRALHPDCILCAVNLPDIDGFWVARRVRAEPPPVGVTPFLFLTDAEDREGRLQGLNVGADSYLTKPFRAEELVAQVGSFIEMARRLKASGLSSAPPSSQAPAAFHGDLAQMAVSTVLTVLELERRTGSLAIKGQGTRNALLELAGGALVRAELDGVPFKPADLLREVLSWKRGSFQFRPRPSMQVRGQRHSLTELLLEAVRLEDEAGRR